MMDRYEALFPALGSILKYLKNLYVCIYNAKCSILSIIVLCYVETIWIISQMNKQNV